MLMQFDKKVCEDFKFIFRKDLFLFIAIPTRRFKIKITNIYCFTIDFRLNLIISIKPILLNETNNFINNNTRNPLP